MAIRMRTETEVNYELATDFLAEMSRRGVTHLADPALRYHLALLLRKEGHPTVRPKLACADDSDSEGA